MITDNRGRTVVLITGGLGQGRVGAVDDSRPGDTTIRIDLGGTVVQKIRTEFRPLAIGDVLVES